MARRTLLVLFAWALCALGAPASAQKLTYDEYTQAIAQAIRLSDDKRLDKAVRDNAVHTVGHYRGLVMTMIRDPNADNAADREALEEAWERVFEGRTLEHLSRWLQITDSSAMKNFDRARVGLSKAYAEFARFQADKSTTRKPYETLRDSLMKIAAVFEQIGDPLDAADAWGLIAQIYARIPERTVADRKDGIYAIERFVELRQRWDWTKDSHFLQNKNWLESEKEGVKAELEAEEKRRGEGYEGAVRGVDAFLMPEADANELTDELKFAVQSKIKTDMCVQGGPVPMQWAAITVKEAGPTQFLWFKGADIFLVRPGSTKFGVTLDGRELDMRKNPFVEVEANGKLKTASKFALDGEGRRPYAMWFFVGGAQQPYMGLNQNLQPTRDNAVVYYKSASSWVADIDGTDVTFFDDNSNGTIFEEDPYAYSLKDRNIGAGPDEEVAVPAYDSVKVGRGKVQPFSDWMKIGDGWFHVRGLENRTKVGVRAVNQEYFKTGMIQLEWSGGRNTRPAVLIVQGRGDFRGARFDLSGGKPVEVPVGEYQLMFGRIEAGKGARLMTANIFGGTSEAVTVVEGETATLALGAPFRLDFSRKGSDTEVEIDALTMRVRGSGGELYSHVNGAAPAPAVMVARADNGKGAREVGEFIPIRDPETLNQVSMKNATLGSHVGFYPIPKGSRGETVLKVRVPAGHFVGLQQKKNKLFGKLEPIFK